MSDTTVIGILIIVLSLAIMVVTRRVSKLEKKVKNMDFVIRTMQAKEFNGLLKILKESIDRTKL